MITVFSELPEVRAKHKNDRIAFTGGCFDLLHEGHIEGLSFAREQGDLLCVGVVTDERVRQRKGDHRPIIPEMSRLAVVDALRVVDYSFLMPRVSEGDLRSPTIRVIDQLRPDIFVEHAEADHWTEEEQLLLAGWGTELIIDTSAKVNSTTKLVGQIIASQTIKV